jgi:parallel beta-helix repeat protein
MEKSTIIKSTILVVAISLFANIFSFVVVSDQDNQSQIVVNITKNKSFYSIQGAIDNASDGDSIFVNSGIYYENVEIINKKITLIGDKNSTIYGNGSKDVIYVSSDCVNIRNFKITNSGPSGGDSGIEIHGDLCKIEDNVIYCNTVGIKLRESNNCTISNNKIHLNKDYGIFLHSSKSNFISKNYVSNNRWGIFLFRYSNFNFISNNEIIQNNLQGIWISWSGNNNLKQNFVEDNAQYGILISGSYNTKISKNNIYSNGEGIFLSQCTDSKIFKNNFRQNIIDASIMSGDNQWKSNYWGKTRYIPKLIFDITVSVLPHIEIDWSPALEPISVLFEKSKSIITENRKYIQPSSSNISSLPESFDWRDINGVDYTTLVKNQVPAPTCEAYALCASLETLMQKKIGHPYEPDLSETHLYFYAGGTVRGGGVLLGDAAEYLVEYGVPDEGCFPDPKRSYDFPFESLPGWEQRTIKISEWGWVDNNLDSIKQALVDYGPLIICVVQRPDFLSYSGGVYFPSLWQSIVNGHVITIVGYNDDQQCWIVKNSAGENWGEEGYVRIAYNADTASHPIIVPFYGGTGIMYITGLYGNFIEDVPKIEISNLKKHRTYFNGHEFETFFKNLPNVEKAVPRIIGYGDIDVKTEDTEGVKFYIDGNLQYVDEEEPFNWKFKTSFGFHTIEAVGYNSKYISKEIVDIFFLWSYK